MKETKFLLFGTDGDGCWLLKYDPPAGFTSGLEVDGVLVQGRSFNDVCQAIGQFISEVEAGGEKK